MSTCRTCESDTPVEEATPECSLKTIRSKSLAISGGCPDAEELWIELPDPEPEPECTAITSLFPSDTIEVMRNGQCHTITIADFMAAIECKRECL